MNYNSNAEGMAKKKSNFFLFLIGTFSMTQFYLIGSIGISELFMFIAAPFVYAKTHNVLRKDGFGVFLLLVVLTLISCVASCIDNGTTWFDGIRGFASIYSLFAGTVVLHNLLRNNLGGLKYLLVGFAVTVVINTFVFQRGVESIMYADYGKGLEATEGIMSSPIYWIGRLKPWLMLPIQGNYFKTPILYSAFMPLLFALFALFTTASGRSAALASIGGCVLVLIGRKKLSNMRIISKYFIFIFVIGFCVLVLFKSFYHHAASSGMLGEKARVKIEAQTHGDNSLKATIVGGRVEFFIGLYAAFRKPWLGYGPWAVDNYGICEGFLREYGNPDAVAEYDAYVVSMARAGQSPKRRWIPAHSHIVGFWVYYGILGLALWLYVLFRIMKLFKDDIAAIPAWYGYFAIGAPAVLWDIFFSPFGSRVHSAAFITATLLATAVRKGHVPLTIDVMAPEQSIYFK